MLAARADESSVEMLLGVDRVWMMSKGMTLTPCIIMTQGWSNNTSVGPTSVGLTARMVSQMGQINGWGGWVVGVGHLLLLIIHLYVDRLPVDFEVEALP